MKQKTITTLIVRLRICVMILILTVISLFLFSFVASTKLGDEVWKQLGMNKTDGNESIYRSFTSGYLHYYQARNVRNLSNGDKLTVTKDLLNYSKQYFTSAEFKAAYTKERQDAKPSQPELKPERTKAEAQKELIADAKKALAELEENMKKMDADTKKNMQGIVELYKTQIKQYEDPNNELFASMASGDQSMNQQARERFKEDVAEWEKNYPEDYTLLLKERLKHFLNITNDVDFNAALKTQYNKNRFVNPAYESKSTEWKQAFRAGKEVTTYARTFAQQWLNELK